MARCPSTYFLQVLVFFVDGLVPIDMLIFTRGCSALFLPGLKKQNQKNNVNPNKNKHEFQTEHSLKIYVFFWVLSKFLNVHIKLAQVPRLCESELPHLFCIKFGGTCAWILLEKLLT
jgi:hypothetical protein